MKKLSLLLCVILFMTMSCHKPKLVGEFYLTAKTKALNPFSGYEKLTFKDDTGPDEILVGDARINKITKSYIDDESGDFVLWEQDYSLFFNDQYALNIMIAYSEMPGLMIDFRDLVDGYNFYSGFKIRDDSIIGRFYDSILIHQVWYHHIYYDTMIYDHHQPFPADIQRFPVKSYYSVTSGVVKIDFSDNSSLELEKIEWTE